MGDFDRNVSASSDKPNETKKMVVVLGLGVVLIGLVAMQMMKKGNGPQPAVGAPAGNGVALPPPVLTEEISPNALAVMTAQLQNDPTSQLLKVGHEAGDPKLDAVPRNPFALSSALLANLRTEPRIVPAPVTPNPVQPTPTPVAVAIPAPRREDFKLSMISGDMAIINGRIVRVGDIVDPQKNGGTVKGRVLQIRSDAVLLQNPESIDGATIEISTSPTLN
jgi:hypothetical protein